MEDVICGESFVGHLVALRRTLLACIAVTVAAYPPCFCLSPYVIDALVRWSFPESLGPLHYFSPLEAFGARLQVAAVLALAMAYPWNVFQAWRFLLPALRRGERRMLGGWIVASSVLFFGGVAFCVWGIIPLLMAFAGSFASPELIPMLGLAHFLRLAGWLSLAFALAFQCPVIVLFLVRHGIVSRDALRRKRPYVIVAILTMAAILTPPDILSQAMLALPAWLLFELGLLLAKPP